MLELRRKSIYEINFEELGDFIRLVRPVGQIGEQLLYELKTFALESVPPYTALSYSWGTKAQTAAILLDNGTTRESLDITEDLEDALKSIKVECVADRPECAKWTGWLWVDQICINQADNLEKGHQVGRMKEIYSEAECVFIWLGKEVLDDGYSSLMAAENNSNIMPEGYWSITEEPDCGLFYCKIIDLLRQGLHCWWNRLWVVQEISICEHLLVWIGGRAFEWESFAYELRNRMKRFSSLVSGNLLPAQWLSVPGSTPMDYREATLDATEQMLDLQRLRRTLSKQKDGEDLLNLLRSTLPSGVSNELDRVYALLGLATNDFRENVAVTYGVPPALVFSSIIQHSINRSGNLDVLFDEWPRGSGLHADIPRFATNAGLGMLSSHTVASLPTWLPDFSQPTQREFATVTQSRYKAATFARPRVNVIHGLELCLTAVVLDTVKSKRKVSRAELSDHFEFLEKTDVEDPGTQSRMCLRVLADLGSPNDKMLPPRAGSPAFWTQFDLCSLSGKICFRTTQGYLGFASAVDVGDEVIVPLGASAPFIIRIASTENDEGEDRPQNNGTASPSGPTTSTQQPMPTKRQICKLVGDCYVDNIMNGQLKHPVSRGHMQTKEYRIS